MAYTHSCAGASSRLALHQSVLSGVCGSACSMSVPQLAGPAVLLTDSLTHSLNHSLAGSLPACCRTSRVATRRSCLTRVTASVRA